MIVYDIDAARTELVVLVRAEGFASALAHDHVVRATRFNGRMESRDGSPETASVVITVEAGSLRTDEPAMRRKHHLTGDLDEDSRRKTQANMEDRGQLDVARFSRIIFESTRIEAATPGSFRVTGNFTLHGVTKRIECRVAAEEHDDELRVRGSFTIRQRDFGITPYSALLGAIRNRDEATIELDAVAVRAAQ